MCIAVMLVATALSKPPASASQLRISRYVVIDEPNEKCMLNAMIASNCIDFTFAH
jgi:hypothetical protein